MCLVQASLPTYVGSAFVARSAIPLLPLTYGRANAPHGELSKASADEGRGSRVDISHGAQDNQVVPQPDTHGPDSAGIQST